MQPPQHSPADSKAQPDDDRGSSRPGSAKGGKGQQSGHSAWQFLSPVWLETFTLTFLAEWGDRSQVRARMSNCSLSSRSMCIMAWQHGPEGLYSACTRGSLSGSTMLTSLGRDLHLHSIVCPNVQHCTAEMIEVAPDCSHRGSDMLQNLS